MENITIFAKHKKYHMEEFKKDGFKGQRSIILPEWVKEELKSNAITASLYVTDIGFYPNAGHHYRQREVGCDEYILIYSINGRGWIEVDEKRQQLCANQFFIIPRNTPHRYGADKNAPWSIYWMHFDGEKSSIVDPVQNRVCDIDLTNDSKIKERIDLFEQILSLLEMGYSMDNLEYASISALGLLASFRYTTQFRFKKTEVKNTVYDAIVFMRENIYKPMKLKDISEHSGYSASHFTQIFREKTAYSPLEYFTQLKMQQASQYLEFSDLSIKEIAFRLGYNDPLYFTKVFNKNFGTPPSKFKTKLR